VLLSALHHLTRRLNMSPPLFESLKTSATRIAPACLQRGILSRRPTLWYSETHATDHLGVEPVVDTVAFYHIVTWLAIQ